MSILRGLEDSPGEKSRLRSNFLSTLLSKDFSRSMIWGRKLEKENYWLKRN